MGEQTDTWGVSDKDEKLFKSVKVVSIKFLGGFLICSGARKGLGKLIPNRKE